MSSRKYRLAYLVTHPIQYQAPMLRLIAAEPSIDLTVFYQSDVSLRAYHDTGFGRDVKWDIDLLGGYRHEFLPGLRRDRPIESQMPINWGLWSRLRPARFDALWVHGYSRWVNWMAIASARARGLKVFVRDEANLFSATRSPTRRQAKRVFFHGLRRLTDAFLAIGSNNRDYYLAHGVEPERIFDMPYCVDNDFFAARARQAAGQREALRANLQLEPGRAIILYASKFEPRKRPQDLLHAYEHLVAGGVTPKPYLLFVGDGALRAGVEAEAREKRFDGVRFLGFRNQTELPALFDLCDVFVLPSTDEPWGLVVNEVMAVGRAVVLSDRVGCARDLVRDGVNGFVFPFGEVARLAAALARVLESRARVQAMGNASLGIMSRWSFNEDLAGLKQALRATFA